MQENRTKELGTRPIGSLLVKYAVPAVIAMTATSLYNIIDRVFIGRIPDVGTLSLSGLAVTFPIINLGAAFGAMDNFPLRLIFMQSLQQRTSQDGTSLLQRAAYSHFGAQRGDSRVRQLSDQFTTVQFAHHGAMALTLLSSSSLTSQ